MVIWSGWGILALVEAAIAFAGIDGIGLKQPIAGLLSGVIAAAAIWFTGRRFNDPAKDRIVVDPATGEQIRLVTRHTLFWIPMQWWAIPAILFGLLLAFGGK
jgi:F0F1-type ATP synthase assembly protein I